MQIYDDIARLYDKLCIDSHDDYWAEYLSGFFPQGAQFLLDCACGNGRLAIEFSRRGYKVIGADVSQPMLEVAAENARKAGVSVPFVAQDMKEIKLHRKVDVIICAFDPVNMLLTADELRRFFKSARDALKTGGALLFDVAEPGAFAEPYRTCTWDEEDFAAIQTRELKENGRALVAVTGFLACGNGLFSRVESEMEYMLWPEQTIRSALEECGFSGVGAYMHMTKEPAMPQNYRTQYAAYAV